MTASGVAASGIRRGLTAGGISRVGRSREDGSGNGTQGFKNALHNARRIELRCSDCAHRRSAEGLDLINRVDRVIEHNGDHIALDGG